MRSRFKFLLFGFCFLVSTAVAQPDLGGLSDFGAFGGFGDDQTDPVELSAQFTPASEDRPAVLMLTAKVDSGWHVFSITQPKGGPKRTVITLSPSNDYRVMGEFRPHPKPKSHVDTKVWKGLTIEEHFGEVTWYVPIEIREGVDPASLTITGRVSLQACKESCVPIKFDFEAKLGKGVPIGEVEVSEPVPVDAPAVTPDRTAAQIEPPTNAGIYRAEGSAVTWYGWLDHGRMYPGGQVQLYLQAQLQDNWHLYAFAQRDPKSGNKPTLIALSPSETLASGLPATKDLIIEEKTPLLPEFGVQRYHEDRVTWIVPITIERGAGPGTYEVKGIVGYQACEKNEAGLGSCELPKGMRFSGTIDVSMKSDLLPTALTLSESSYIDAAALAEQDNSAINVPSPPTPTAGYDLAKIRFGADETLWQILLWAFLGGLVLNIMPCVLPVIGLKIMSFVEQSGHNRLQALILNIWYSLGILAVFWILGGLAISAGLTWGGQFGNLTFNVVMISIVFAMALSLLGVWEIPIPGFLGSGTTQNLSQKEGPFGAFLKGVITTILATPCTGPGMAVALGWAIRQPATTTMLTFTVLGLGMAFPYLLIGAFPSLVKWLPKPGNWMVTFKQLMGFVLVATVVWLISVLHPATVLPTLTLLTGIGIACWWVSRTPPTAESGDRIMAWVTAAVVTGAAALFAFAGLYRFVTLPKYEIQLAQAIDKKSHQTTSELLAKLSSADSADQMRTQIARLQANLEGAESAPWQPFSLNRLGSLAIGQGRTVLVDFSAEWCFNCKTLEATVLHTDPVEQAIEEHNIITMYADFTDYPAEIDSTIRALRSNGVPVIAIFPGDRPYQPIVFRGVYTQEKLIEAIHQAVGERTSGGEVAAMNRSGDLH